MVHAIAARAGVALVDTLGHPGPSHRGGERVPGYLGTLGLYGYHQRSYAFLHPGGKLAPRAEQCVFFLKSKVGQRATNFTPFRRSGAADGPAHATRRSPSRRRRRPGARDGREGLPPAGDRGGSTSTPEDPALARGGDPHGVPTGEDLAEPDAEASPMTPNYFFRELGALVRSALIEEDGYAYTGVYDVGRSRRLGGARRAPHGGGLQRLVRPRALDGGRAGGDRDAGRPRSRGTSSPSVGDGGRIDHRRSPAPPARERARAPVARRQEHHLVFYFSNGTFSGIRTVLASGSRRGGSGRQMRARRPDRARRGARGGPAARRPAHVARDASSPARCARRCSPAAGAGSTCLTVLLGHNSDDDGFSFVDDGLAARGLGRGEDDRGGSADGQAEGRAASATSRRATTICRGACASSGAASSTSR